MEFEEQIRIIAKKIYENVKDFVEENKEDDDLYYSYAFIKVDNGIKIKYDLEEELFEIILTQGSKQDRIVASRIDFSDNDTRIHLELNEKFRPADKYIDYKFSLQDKADTHESKLVNQEDQKEKIKNTYELVYGATSQLTYDKVATHRPENFTWDVYELYHRYMSEKEMDKLDKLTDKVLPAVKAAVDWWGKKIINIEKNDNRLWKGLREESLLPITDEQLDNFKRILTKKIMIEMQEFRDVYDPLKIGVYDYPMIILGDSLEEAGISKSRIPVEYLYMEVHAYLIIVDNGQKGRYQIFNSTTEGDITEVKKQYLEHIKSSFVYTLIRKK